VPGPSASIPFVTIDKTNSDHDDERGLLAAALLPGCESSPYFVSPQRLLQAAVFAVHWATHAPDNPQLIAQA
jgi:hypothetical protein